MTLEPERKNFSVWRGATFRRVITLWQDAAQTVPYNLTGYTAQMLIKDHKGGTTVGTVTASIGGAQNNVITLLATDETTATWTDWDRGVYELKLNAPGNGDVDFLFYGLFTIKDHA